MLKMPVRAEAGRPVGRIQWKKKVRMMAARRARAQKIWKTKRAVIVEFCGVGGGEI